MTKKLQSGFWGVALVAHLLLGYALAGPVRLSFYFYSQPLWDLLIDALLITGAVLISVKWLKPATRYLVLVIPLLAVSWMKTEFLFFSKTSVFELFSYGFIALWAMSITVVWEYFSEKKPGLSDGIGRLLLFASGMYWGFVDQSYTGVMIVSFVFIIALYIHTRKVNSSSKFGLNVAYSLVAGILTVLGGMTIPKPVFHESQNKFEDKVVFSGETDFARVDVTEWNGNHWFYQDGINQFSSIDAWLYFEPFGHPAMQLASNEPKVLVVGGENGMLVKELLKYQKAAIDIMPVDQEYLDWANKLDYFTEQNEKSLDSKRVNLLKDEIFRQLNEKQEVYDIIFIDVPDPIDLELNQYFSLEFYQICHKALKPDGLLVTQSGSPYFATAAFQSIQSTVQTAEFQVAAYHNQILTLGEWAWTVGMKSEQPLDLRDKLKALQFENVQTAWLNNEAMQMMLSFGKPYVTSSQTRVNTIQNPIIHQYYNQGNYQLQ
jgi:spermidine synthase